MLGSFRACRASSGVCAQDHCIDPSLMFVWKEGFRKSIGASQTHTCNQCRMRLCGGSILGKVDETAVSITVQINEI